MRLINMVTAFFIACLLLFYVLAKFHVPLAMIFFVWIGVFNLMVVAQFWSFANVVYSKDEGERLFAIVGFGASLGAVVGARVADRLIAPFGVYELMLVGAAVLIGAAAAHQLHRRARPGAGGQAAPSAEAGGEKGPGTNAFALVFRPATCS